MKKILPVILIALLGTIVYSNTFLCPFQFDDNYYIVNNPVIRNIDNWLNIWQFYPCRFLSFYSIALNYHLHQWSMPGYHLFNLIVHLASAIMVWWLMRMTLLTPAMRGHGMVLHGENIALLAGLVFVAHPIQTEAVTYIEQRAASMGALFYLVSLSSYIKSRLTFRKRWYIFSMVFAFAAMFTKENTCTLPLMILLYEYCFLRTDKGLDWRYIAPIMCTFLIIPLTMFLTKAIEIQEIHRAGDSSSGTSPANYILTQLRVMITYIRLVFFPFNQNVDYDYPIIKSIFEWPAVISFLGLSFIIYTARKLFFKYRLITFSIFWFFLTLLPESGSFVIQDVIFEHRLYLPMVGYSILLVSGAYYFWGSNHFAAMVKILVVIIGCYAALTYQRNKIWHDDFSLWNDALQRHPHKARPYGNRGVAYGERGDLVHAIADFNQAIEIYPNDAKSYCNRGKAYAELGNLPQAIVDYNKAIELNPMLGVAYSNRAIIEHQLRENDQAVADEKKAEVLNESNSIRR